MCTEQQMRRACYAAVQVRGSAQEKEKRANAKAKALTWVRIFHAIFQASSKVQ